MKIYKHFNEISTAKYQYRGVQHTPITTSFTKMFFNELEKFESPAFCDTK